jgi:uncharacterized membrane protein
VIRSSIRAVRLVGLGLAVLLAAGCGGGEPSGDSEAGSEPANAASVGESGGRGGSDSQGSEPRPAASVPGTYVYACADGYTFAVDVAGDSATIELVTREHTLPRVPAASGARYEANDLVFWVQGAEAMLDAGPSQHRDCQAARAESPWDKARLLGVEFRALGQEPGWIVDVHPDRWIRYLGDYGETRLAFPAAAPRRDGASITYSTEAGDHALEVVFRRTPCRDAMSGQPFDFTVSLRVDGRTLDGCGRRLQTPGPTGEAVGPGA